MKVDDSVRRSPKGINFRGWKEEAAAAVENKRLAKANGRTRRLLAELGAIPALVAMTAQSNGNQWKSSATEVLVEMANGAIGYGFLFCLLSARW